MSYVNIRGNYCRSFCRSFRASVASRVGGGIHTKAHTNSLCPFRSNVVRFVLMDLSSESWGIDTGRDCAFRNAQRQSKLVYKYRNATIVVLSGKNSGRLEVGRGRTPSGEEVEVTSIERTLIDIAVRPAYAGGIAEVLEGFRKAQRKGICQ
jgi:hypothetical protein